MKLCSRFKETVNDICSFSRKIHAWTRERMLLLPTNGRRVPGQVEAAQLLRVGALQVRRRQGTVGGAHRVGQPLQRAVAHEGVVPEVQRLQGAPVEVRLGQPLEAVGSEVQVVEGDQRGEEALGQTPQAGAVGDREALQARTLPQRVAVDARQLRVARDVQGPEAAEPSEGVGLDGAQLVSAEVQGLQGEERGQGVRRDVGQEVAREVQRPQVPQASEGRVLDGVDAVRLQRELDQGVRREGVGLEPREAVPTEVELLEGEEVLEGIRRDVAEVVITEVEDEEAVGASEGPPREHVEAVVAEIEDREVGEVVEHAHGKLREAVVAQVQHAERRQAAEGAGRQRREVVVGEAELAEAALLLEVARVDGREQVVREVQLLQLVQEDERLVQRLDGVVGEVEAPQAGVEQDGDHVDAPAHAAGARGGVVARAAGGTERPRHVQDPGAHHPPRHHRCNRERALGTAQRGRGRHAHYGKI